MESADARATGPDPRRERFEHVAAAVYEPLQRYLGRRATPDDAADVLADTLLTVWRRLDDVPADDPLPWCYGVARRALANHRRGAQRRLRLVDRIRTRPVATSPDPAESIEHSDPALSKALAELSLEDQELVRLWAWEQLEPREIAVALGLSANAVSLRLSRARKKLAAAMTASRPEPPDDGRQDDDGAGQEPVEHHEEHRP